MEKISVIVPIYKIEDCLPKCVDSIIAQTYKDLEIILVDDGSPDNCGAICDEYAKKDSRIKVIHKPNGGLSDARNHGIEAATGRYLGFVDGDDYLEPQMYERLHNALVENDAEMSICSFRYVGGYEERNGRLSIKDEVVTGKEILLERRMANNAWWCVVAWNKLYKKELFRELRYPVGKVHEDEWIIHRLLWDVKRVACITYVGYDYIQRETSISHSHNLKTLNAIEAYIDRYDFYKSNRVPVKVRYINLIRSYSVLYGMYKYTDFRSEPLSSRLRACAKELRKRNRALLKESLSFSQRAFLIMNCISPYYTWRLKSKMKRR